METLGAIPSIEANGAKIPLIGLGTWELRGRTCARVVEQALRLGYRHVDTAEMYDNERDVGEGLHASGVKRNDVFVTTKIWPSHFAPRELERSARERLELRTNFPGKRSARSGPKKIAHAGRRG